MRDTPDRDAGDRASDARGLRPVVLLHGTNDVAASVAPLATRLREDGRTVVTPDYGFDSRNLPGWRGRKGGLASLQLAGEETLAHIDAVLGCESGQIDLVGFSQGGLHALAAAQARPQRIAHVVMIGSPLLGLRPLRKVSPWVHRRGIGAMLDMVVGAGPRGQVAGGDGLPVLDRLAAGPRYLLIASRTDRLVPALTHRGMEAYPQIRVQWVQDVEPERRVSHVQQLTDDVVFGLVRAELTT